MYNWILITFLQGSAWKGVLNKEMLMLAFKQPFKNAVFKQNKYFKFKSFRLSRFHLFYGPNKGQKN